MIDCSASNLDFKITQRVGEGMTSEVFTGEIWDKSSKARSIVAFKVLKSQKMDRDFKNELLKYYNIQSEICICPKFWLIHSGRPTLVMDYVDGVSLCNLLSDFEITGTEKQWILDQVKKGILDLHKNDLIHGDINPENILLTSRGAVKLIDIGPKKDEFTPYFGTLDAGLNSRQRDFYALDKLEEFMGIRVAEGGGEIDPIKKLAQRVQFLSLNKSVGTQTMIIKKTHPLNFLVKNFFLAFIIGITLMHSKPAMNAEGDGFSTIVFSPHKWRRVSLGYWSCTSPCKFSGVPLGDYQIQWTNNEGTWTDTLTVSSNTLKVFKEQFFKNRENE